MQRRHYGYVKKAQPSKTVEEEPVDGDKVNYCELIKYDASQPAYNSYLIDYQLYKLFYVSLSPWGKASMAEDLAARLFRVCFDGGDL